MVLNPFFSSSFLSMLSAFLWDVDPAIFSLFGRDVRWYGLLFALSFFIGRALLYHIYRREGKQPDIVESILLYTFISTVIGARLGHVLFYDPYYYFSHPLEILYIHKGGLASHGAALGILIGTAIFCRKKKQSYLGVLDRMVIVVALGGMCIRVGNFMNSEIYGKPTTQRYGVVFVRQAQAALRQSMGAAAVAIHVSPPSRQQGTHTNTAIDVQIQYDRVPVSIAHVQAFAKKKIPTALAHPSIHDHIRTDSLQLNVYEDDSHTYVEFPAQGVSRHPTQLYEALFCLLLFALLYTLWRVAQAKRWSLPDGFLLALFLVLLWSFRLSIEFLKVPQEEFTHSMALNVGQWLSIPLIAIGLGLMILLWHRHQKKTRPYT